MELHTLLQRKSYHYLTHSNFTTTQNAQFIVADKGYDSDSFVSAITAQGAQAVIPPRSNCINPRPFDRHIYGSRNLIERFFACIKQFRRIATRYDKLANSFSFFFFLSFISLPLSFGWLNWEQTLGITPEQPVIRWWTWLFWKAYYRWVFPLLVSIGNKDSAIKEIAFLMLANDAKLKKYIPKQRLTRQ